MKNNKCTRTAFGNNLRKLLKLKGMTQAELASATGITRATINKYLCTKASLPRIDHAATIATVLEVTLDYLCLRSTENDVDCDIHVLKQQLCQERAIRQRLVAAATRFEQDIKNIREQEKK